MIKKKLEEIEMLWNMKGKTSKHMINNQQIRFRKFEAKVLKELEVAQNQIEKEILTKYQEKIEKYTYFAKEHIRSLKYDQVRREKIAFNNALSNYYQDPENSKDQMLKLLNTQIRIIGSM